MYTANEKRYDTMKYDRCGNENLDFTADELETMEEALM